MIHAVFIDYTGTTIQESGMELKEVVARICKNSRLRQPRDVMNAWWGLVKQYENSSFGDSYQICSHNITQQFCLGQHQ